MVHAKKTNEQKNAEVKELTAKLETGVKELFNSTEYIKYLNTLSKFHNYSFNNCLLILMQCPEASRVAGFQTWRKTFNRNVNKGEKAIKILAPMPCKFTKVEKDQDGNETETEVNYTRFFATSVFDISQTSGEELPEICHKLESTTKNYDLYMEALKTASPVEINIEEISTEANGYYSHATNSITIKKGLSEAQTIKTGIHEVAHSILHHKETGTDKEANRNTREVEAESVAYIVSNYFGLDTADYSFGYIASWSKGKELKELQNSLEHIQKTAKQIIEAMEQTLVA